MKKIYQAVLVFLAMLFTAAAALLVLRSERMFYLSLCGRRALFCGDSISYGAFDSQEGRAWAGRIGEKYFVKADNRSVNGASLSTIRPDRIIQQLEGAKGESYDYIILQGGVNDAWGDGYTAAAPGHISKSFSPDEFDTDTFAGALEELFCYARTYFPDAKLGFIITYATPNAEGMGRLTDMEEYYSQAVQICEKWSVACLNLYDDNYVNQNLLCTGEYKYMFDSIHINSSGYDRLAPYIAEWMSSFKLCKLKQ